MLKAKKLRRPNQRIGIDKWNLDCVDDFKKQMGALVDRALREAMAIATKEYEPHVYFPIQWAPGSDGWNGKAVKDPTTIYVSTPLGKSDADGPAFSFLLGDVVHDFLDMNCDSEGKLDPDMRDAAAAIRDALRKMAEDLDAAMGDGVTLSDRLGYP